MFAPHIVPGPNGRVAPGTNTLSILAPPGNYTVRLTVGNVTETKPLVVRKDPNSGGTEGDIAAQTAALMPIGLAPRVLLKIAPAIAPLRMLFVGSCLPR